MCSYNNLTIGKDSKFAQFWLRALLTYVKIDQAGQALTFGMPKRVLPESFTNFEPVSVQLLKLKFGP
jgi:hypothetical protein